MEKIYDKASLRMKGGLWVSMKLSAKWAGLSGMLFFISCEKNITVDLPEAESKIVVEGYIEPGEKPSLLLTRSVGFFAPVDSSSLLDYTVSNAVITITDGTTTDTLKPNIFFPFFYEATTMTGEAGKTYSITIHADGQTLSATTSLPSPIALDSLWFKIQEDFDSLGYVWAHLTDPDTIGNNYRWFAKRIGKDETFYAPIGSVFEDKFINGKSFDFGYNRGTKPNSDEEDDNNIEAGFFKAGDTIAVKFCTIDRASFEFWRTYETQVANNGNPFGVPAPITSNIIGGLGIWGGYSAVYDTVIAVK